MTCSRSCKKWPSQASNPGLLTLYTFLDILAPTMTAASPGPVRTPGQTPTPPDSGSGRHPQHRLIKDYLGVQGALFSLQGMDPGPQFG